MHLGCNFLMKTNRAALINDPKDLIYMMGWEQTSPHIATPQFQMPLGLCDAEQRVLNILKTAPSLIDEIAVKSEMSQSKLAIHLLNLELQGLLTVLPGKLYKVNCL